MDTIEYQILIIVAGLWLLTMWRELRKLREWQRVASAALRRQTEICKDQAKKLSSLTVERDSLNKELSVARPRNEEEANDFATWRSLRQQYPEGLERMITQAGHITRTAGALSRLKIQCSVEAPLLSTAAMSAYLDSIDAQIAIVPGSRSERPLEIAIRHADGWVTLMDGFHDMVFIDGRLTGVYAAAVAVPPREVPMVRQRERIGGPVRRTLDL